MSALLAHHQYVTWAGADVNDLLEAALQQALAVAYLVTFLEKGQVHLVILPGHFAPPVGEARHTQWWAV